MRNAHPRKLEAYRTLNGREPFTEWFESLRAPPKTQDRIQARLDYLKSGNFGDCKSVREGLLEMRIHFGAGSRIYFSEVGNTIVLLLCGGDKSVEARDINRAKTYWGQYKETYL